MPMPKQNPATSRQDFGTPPEFIIAAVRRLGGAFALDVCASWNNAICTDYYDKITDGLSQSWLTPGGTWAYCNPEFRKLRRWLEKAAAEAKLGASVACLVPAATGANWWRDLVHGHAYILHLNGRITFVGEKDPYPKDCALILYTPVGYVGADIWSWCESLNG